MNLAKVLSELKDKLARLNESIASLERLASASGKRRGRPPAWLKAEQKATVVSPSAKRRGRPPKQVLG